MMTNLILNMAQLLKCVNAINKLKNKGIKIKANGIKTLKFSSKVRELVIHEIPLK